MSKRPVSPSSIDEHPEAKKPKLECTTEHSSPETTAPVDQVPQPVNTVDDNGSQNEPLAEQNTQDAVADSKTKKNKTKRKAGEGFRPWKPKPAYVDIPPVQPHWAIIPRTGGYRPSEAQLPARTSHAAVRPALWEDRKGGVRLKRGSRFIDGYDQAYHMWLPLMDVRPISVKNQTPRRVPVSYHYPHGMIVDWNDSGALNDVNKALQEAIRAKSNKEASWTPTERSVLAKVCAENPDASIWYIAEQFNDLAHPILGNEEGQYPKGRFIESICHEYRIYKPSYVKGEAPTDTTEKDIELEKRYATMKAAASKTKANLKKSKTSNQPSTPKMSAIAGVTKKKRTLKRPDKKQKVDEMAGASDAAASQPSEPTVPMSEQRRLSDDEEMMLEVAGAYDMEDVRPSSPLSPYTRPVIASSSYGFLNPIIESELRSLVAQTRNGSGKSYTADLSDNAVVPSSPPAAAQAREDVQNPQAASQSADAVAAIHAEIAIQIEEAQAVGNRIQSASLVEAGVIEVPIKAQTEVLVQDPRVEVLSGTDAGVHVSHGTTTNTAENSNFVEKAVRDTQIDEDYDDDDNVDDML